MVIPCLNVTRAFGRSAISASFNTAPDLLGHYTLALRQTLSVFQPFMHVDPSMVSGKNASVPHQLLHLLPRRCTEYVLSSAARPQCRILWEHGKLNPLPGRMRRSLPENQLGTSLHMSLYLATRLQLERWWFLQTISSLGHTSLIVHTGSGHHDG